jgi:hypothetical protein
VIRNLTKKNTLHVSEWQWPDKTWNENKMEIKEQKLYGIRIEQITGMSWGQPWVA